MEFKSVSVVGLGYIGLPTAAVIASRGIKVIGLDVNQHAVDTINAGNVHIVEPDLDIVVRSAVQAGNLKATTVAENKGQAHALELLIEYYKTGDLKIWDAYNIAWVASTEGDVDYINSFIEVYNDPLGYTGSYETVVELKDFKNLNKGIATSKECLYKLRLKIRDMNNFPNSKSEIHFFKADKPFVLGYLKYFVKLHAYMMEKPTADLNKQRLFIH